MYKRGVFSVLVLVLLSLPISAAPPGQLIILEAAPNVQTGLLTIVGVNFGSLAPTVAVSGQTLAVQTFSDTQIVAVMLSLTPGTYLLAVTRGNAMVEQDTFSLTVGSGVGGGDIESIVAGDGLSGGGSSGDVTLEVDFDLLDANYLLRNGANNDRFARLDVDNTFQEDQVILGSTFMTAGFDTQGPGGVHIEQPNAGAFHVANYAETGSNRAITAEVFAESSTAVAATSNGLVGGLAGAFEARGDMGLGIYTVNRHTTGQGSAIFAEVFSANAIPGYFRNNAGGLILQGIGNTWPPVFTVDGAGTVTATAFISTSSQRYKTNVANLEGGLPAIERLRPVSFEWKSNGRRDIGLIAEEVAAVIPDAVALDAEGAAGIDYPSLTAFLIQAVQEQQRQIRELQRLLEDRD